jgi:hypothetical protein
MSRPYHSKGSIEKPTFERCAGPLIKYTVGQVKEWGQRNGKGEG